MSTKEDSQFKKMTETPVEKLIITLSIPTIMSMLVSNIYNLVDTAFVGTLGNSASGAVGVVFGFMSIIQAIGFLFGQGAGSIISRELGKRKVQDANIVASTGFFFAFFLALIVALVCFIFINPLIFFLGSTSTIAPYAKDYILFILITAPFMVTSFTLNNILRYEGKAFFGMIGLMIGAILNIVGDAFFIFVFNMGIKGAGLSTAISQIISFAILLIPFFTGKTETRLSIKYVKIKMRLIFEIVSTGFPSLLRQGLNCICTILLNKKAGFYGDAAVAAMSIVSRIFFFIFSIAIGVGQGFQPVCGFNFGAKKYSRVQRAWSFTLFISEILIIIICGVVYFRAAQFVRIFRDDEFVIKIATRALKLQCVASLFLPLSVATEMMYQSSGKKLGATILSSIRSGLFYIPLIFVCAYFRGLKGIQEAQPISYVLSFFPALFFAIKFFKEFPSESNL